MNADFRSRFDLLATLDILRVLRDFA